MKTPDLVCVGHIVQEMIHFPDGIRGPFLGSPPAYCGVAAARQGTSVGLVTKIGHDTPMSLLSPLMEAGVDCSGVREGPRTTATDLIYDDKGNKEIRYPSKADPIRAVDIPDHFRGCRLIYVCTMDNDVLPKDMPGVVAFGKVSAVDLGGYGGVHMSKANRDAIGSPPALAREVASHFQIVKASDEDAISIFGWDDPHRSAEELLACGPQVVVITAGSKGAFAYAEGHRWHIPPFACNAIDTTGGGDTFMAGFLCEYLRSADPEKAAAWGAATASCVIEGTGGVRVGRMPTDEQVQERLAHVYTRT